MGEIPTAEGLTLSGGNPIKEVVHNRFRVEKIPAVAGLTPNGKNPSSGVVHYHFRVGEIIAAED